MNAARLTKIAQALYGPKWKGKLAAAMKLDPSTIRRWVAANKVPPGRALTLELMEKTL